MSGVTFLQGAPGAPATADGNGTATDSSLFLQAQIVEIVESNGGTATVTLEGSFDGSTWYSLGYQRTDATATLARATADISVLANSKHVYQVLDPYPQIRARISSSATSPKLTVKLYAVGS